MTDGIQQISDEELTRWIAETIEPVHSQWAGHILDAPKLQAWLPIYSSDKANHWQPRDMVNDPAMTLMLLEKLLEKGFHFTLWPSPGQNPQGQRLVTIHISDSLGFFEKIFGRPVGRAVAESFALALGYTKETNE